MSTFWLSFRIDIDTVGGRSMNQRYDALIEAIKAVRNVPYWERTTSFIVFESVFGIDSIAAKFKGAIAPSKDLFLLKDLDAKSARICGSNWDKDIYSLMPYLADV